MDTDEHDSDVEHVGTKDSDQECVCTDEIPDGESFEDPLGGDGEHASEDTINIVTEPTNIKGILKTGDPEPSTVLPRKTDEKGDATDQIPTDLAPLTLLSHHGVHFSEVELAKTHEFEAQEAQEIKLLPDMRSLAEEYYRKGCERWCIPEVAKIKEQLKNINSNENFTATLDLSEVSVTFAMCNALEEVLVNCNFKMITVDYSMFDYSISNFIDMLSYYDSAVGIISIQVPLEDDLCLWTQFTTYLANSRNLRRVEFRGVEFKHANMRLLLNAVQTNDQIDALILDACAMPQLSASIFELIRNVKSLQEIGMAYTFFYRKEVEMVTKIVTLNRYIKVLDLSYSYLGDRGLSTLSRGLIAQTQNGFGIRELNLVNTSISENAEEILPSIIKCCTNLRVLNLGRNVLTDNTIYELAVTLANTNTIVALGLQSTHLTPVGLGYVKDALKHTKALRVLNVRNNLLVPPDDWEKLADTLPFAGIFHVEMDPPKTTRTEAQVYEAVYNKMRQLCQGTINLYDEEFKAFDGMYNFKHIKEALLCEPRWIPVGKLRQMVSVRMKPQFENQAGMLSRHGRFFVTSVPENSKNNKPNQGAGGSTDSGASSSTFHFRL